MMSLLEAKEELAKKTGATNWDAIKRVAIVTEMSEAELNETLVGTVREKK